MKNKLTQEQKYELYKNGCYKFKCPPVCTVYWTTSDWIKWVDACNGWIDVKHDK